MSKPLLRVGELIAGTLEQFFRDWRETLNVSIWFLAPPILLGLGAWLANALPSFGPSLFFACQLAGAVVALVTTIRLTKFILAKDRDPKARLTLAASSWRLFFSFLWIAILTYLAILGGFLLLVLPSIWLAVALSFSQLFLFEDEVRGVQALSASAALVKGRWWPVLWRWVLPGIVFMIFYLFVLALISAVIGLIAGFAQVGSLMDLSNPSLAATFLQYFIQSLGQVLMSALFVTWQVKLFHGLKDSR